MIRTVGSVCSGIEAASVAWAPLGAKFVWFSEIAEFPSAILRTHYPTIPNYGDMTELPGAILQRKIPAPDIICGGTPCQAFSLAGQQNGLNDDRGDLTLRFVDIIDAVDTIRKQDSLSPCTAFWENVEGVLSDKTNPFGHFLARLAGLEQVPCPVGKRWPSAGLLRSSVRNIAWRVLDAKYFGLPQQRRRLYVIAGGCDFSPENILFEPHQAPILQYPDFPLVFEKEQHHFEIFRAYTDCLYAAYGTKWNGNAAAYNGSLFVVQDHRIRRLSVLECERLMGFPDNYTALPSSKKTNRYQAVGNSWAVPVVRWIGERLIQSPVSAFEIAADAPFLENRVCNFSDTAVFFDFGKDALIPISDTALLNCTAAPEHCRFSSLEDIVSPDAPEDIYISPVGCFGIVRRKRERNLSINSRLEEVLLSISSQMSASEIEKRSRVQQRGRFSTPSLHSPSIEQLSLF